jgi:hypothetical protein
MGGKVAGDDDVDTLKTDARAVNTQYFIARGLKDRNERHENIRPATAHVIPLWRRWPQISVALRL